jgi:pSer/pThr/pTyr-binding forkhead associated (FHA) protein
MQVVLVMFRPEGDRRSFSITRETTVVGRREDCDFRIPLGEISRKHCRLIKDGDALRIEDLGSSNGTYHNGTRVQEATLSPGDTLQIGSVVFVVQIDGVPADDELQPVATASAGRDGHSVETAPMTDDAPTSNGGHDNGEFDPMSVLDSNDSAVPQDDLVLDLDDSQHDHDLVEGSRRDADV